jgi:hypothetical protein
VTIKEIQESGLIEYYVLGLLSEKEVSEVRGYLEKYPVLQKDYNEIQSTMQIYAQANAVVPRNTLSNDITEYIKKNSKDSIETEISSTNTSTTPNSSSGFLKSLSAILGIATLGLIGLFISKNNDYKDLQKSRSILKNECDSIQSEQSTTLKIYESLNNPSNNSVKLTPTENYQNTQLIFHNNKTDKRNFIQIQNLPKINKDQAFQLWSLKEGVDPIPLTVFTKGDNYILPVDYEEGTQTYAITIEDAAGAQVPTLTRLIGTVGV